MRLNSKFNMVILSLLLTMAVMLVGCSSKVDQNAPAVEPEKLGEAVLAKNYSGLYNTFDEGMRNAVKFNQLRAIVDQIVKDSKTLELVSDKTEGEYRRVSFLMEKGETTLDFVLNKNNEISGMWINEHK